MGLEYVKGICYILCLFLPNTGLLSWSLFSPYWINDKSNNGTTECFRGVLFNVGCVDEDKRLGDAVLGFLIAYYAGNVLGLIACLRIFLIACNDEDGTASGDSGSEIQCYCLLLFFYGSSGFFGIGVCGSVDDFDSDHEKGSAYYLCFAALIYQFIQACLMPCVTPLVWVLKNIKKEKQDCVIRARHEVTSYVIYGSNPSSEGVVLG